MTCVMTEKICAVPRSFRVAQVEGMFDLSAEQAATIQLHADVPSLDESWTIGAIVGNSGSGKTSIAEAAFPGAIGKRKRWPTALAMIDGLPKRSIHELTAALTAVGLGSTPTWLRPFGVLSGGEQFRAEMAHALLRRNKLVIVDEFTSVLDRTTAKFGALAIGNALRKERFAKRLVTVGCHRDVLPWLAPDWVVDLDEASCTWNAFLPKSIDLQIDACSRSLWASFAPHHYLCGGDLPAAQFFAASFEGRPVAIIGLIGLWGHRGHKRVARIVTLPEFQGVGIGSRLLDEVAQRQRGEGFVLNITAGHPSILRHCQLSERWQLTKRSPIGRRGQGMKNGKPVKSSFGRPVMSFRYAG